MKKINKISNTILRIFIQAFGGCNGKADKILHFLGSFFIYLVAFALFVWISKDWPSSMMLSAFLTYVVGRIKENGDIVFDPADIHANINGIMAGMVISIVLGVVVW